MATENSCPKCGAAIPTDARWGICPKCLLDPEAGLLSPEPGSLPTSFGQKGRRFGDYELGPQIGKGGMGVVYEAVQLRARRRVAVKMILDTHVTSLAARRRFTIEAEAAAKLDHPNIVPIYEVGEKDEQPFLSMKLVEGESLRALITETGFREPSGKDERGKEVTWQSRQTSAARLMTTVARAVHHAHQKGVIHRDLKPGNILIDQEGQPHLTDFGLAKILALENSDPSSASITHSGAILGTPSYMSPEQASNQRLTAASDVYSLGAILYELLTGQVPFKGNTLVETIRLVAEQEPKRPRALRPEIDPDLETICLKCLEKAPDTRYGSALGLAEDIERWLRQEPVTARRAGPALRARRWVKRNPLGTGLILSLCGCLVVSLALLRLARQRDEMKELTIANSQYEFTKEVNLLWDRPDQREVRIFSSRLAALAGMAPREPAQANAVTITFARTISESPVEQAIRFAPFLRVIEKQMEGRLHRPVFMDLLLCRDRSWADPAVSRGDAHLQSLSPLTYVRLKQPGSKLTSIVWWGREQEEGILFARLGAGVTNLSQVRGHSAVFAHSNSIVSFLAKAYLARAGICSTDLTACRVLQRTEQREAPESRLSTAQGEAESENEDYAHREVIQRVLAGEYDVGVATSRRFELNRHRGQGLVKLLAFPITPNVLVVGAQLDAKVVSALQQCICHLPEKDRPRLMSKFNRSAGEGIIEATDTDFDEMRGMLANELVFFERGVRTRSKPGKSPK